MMHAAITCDEPDCENYTDAYLILGFPQPDEDGWVERNGKHFCPVHAVGKGGRALVVGDDGADSCGGGPVG